MTKHTTITAPNISKIEYVALDKLYLSDLNPRQEADNEGIEHLAQSLVACGLIQNLSGLKDSKGKIGVVAGGRRLRALKIAVLEEPNLAHVPVRIAPDAHTAETWANVENAARADLHPADEIRAFGKMYAKSMGVARIAKVFGTTEAHVYRRLALAELPNSILDALKAGEINLSMANAFTVSNDKKHSLEVLEMVRGEATSAHRMKSLLKPDAISGTNRRAVFVGKEAYEAEGGKVGGDLFSEETTFDNPEILEAVFHAKLTDTANKTKEADGWKWVETAGDSYLGYWDIEQGRYSRIYRTEGELSEDQATRYDELVDLAQNRDLDEAGKTELARLQAILDGEYTEEQKAHAGLIVYVNQSGELSSQSGLIKREDKNAAIEAGILKKSAHQRLDKPKSPYSQKLADDLEAIRLGARQNAAVNKAEMLLDLLAFQLSGHTGYRKVFELRLDAPSNQPTTETGFALDERLTTPNETEDDAWDSALADTFEKFQAKGKKHRNAEITRHLAAVLTGGDDAFKAEIDSQCETSIRSVWTPTAENFFKRVNAAYLENLYGSLLDLESDSAATKAFVAFKKGDKAERLEKLFSDEATQKALGVTKEQKSRIDTWVPEYFG
ncbi:hypothetical protein A9Q96_09535 [Rhodobacterales bacterium 52_120_T64]|nr:hypothetical protein A9Q96_09535 [Rhodobacterales bacterium 52_120_T64]